MQANCTFISLWHIFSGEFLITNFLPLSFPVSFDKIVKGANGREKSERGKHQDALMHMKNQYVPETLLW
jgi:hypothetical protein